MVSGVRRTLLTAVPRTRRPVAAMPSGAGPRPPHAGGMPASSRWSERSADHRKPCKADPTPAGVAQETPDRCPAPSKNHHAGRMPALHSPRGPPPQYARHASTPVTVGPLPPCHRVPARVPRMPEACQRVAGGRSAAQTTGHHAKLIRPRQGSHKKRLTAARRPRRTITRAGCPRSIPRAARRLSTPATPPRRSPSAGCGRWCRWRWTARTRTRRGRW